METRISIQKDNDWYLAEVVWYDYLYARWSSKEEAKQELWYVIDMMREQHLAQAEEELALKTSLFQLPSHSYAL